MSVDPPGLDLPAALLAATFPEGPPRRLVQVLGTPDRRAMTRFKAAPIIAGRPRFFVADTGEPVAWAARVEAAWPGASAFLSRAPVGTRRMVDSDGEEATLYLDDLQDVDHDFPTPGGVPAMALRLDLASGWVETLTRHEGPPPLSGVWVSRARPLLPLGDLWAVMWGPEGCCGLLVVNQERHRGRDPSGSLPVVDGLLGHDPRWQAACELVREAGLVPYADAVALDRHGGVEATLGIWEPPR